MVLLGVLSQTPLGRSNPITDDTEGDPDLKPVVETTLTTVIVFIPRTETVIGDIFIELFGVHQRPQNSKKGN